jgi:hypothetical protein
MKQAQPIGCACFFICFVKYGIFFDIVGGDHWSPYFLSKNQIIHRMLYLKFL